MYLWKPGAHFLQQTPLVSWTEVMKNFGEEDKQLVFDVIEKWDLEDWFKNMKETALLFTCFTWMDVNKTVLQFPSAELQGLTKHDKI